AFIALGAAHLPIMSGVPADTMVVCGMAAVMAGVVRAPLMTIFIVVEMTHTLQLLPAVALSALVAWGVSTLIYRPAAH
ncbi:MAG: chloride channel protein, partial [Muribaculum sp.]|nr:chloride channel protein [Muribaculum sp.]